MGEIISIEDKLDSGEKRRAAVLRQRKIGLVRKFYHLTRNTGRCEKCHADPNPDSIRPFEPSCKEPRLPYRFCGNCRQEYLDYIERLKGGGDRAEYWHSVAWIQTWDRWIEYQAALDRYTSSRAFKRLVAEIKNEGPEKPKPE